MTTGRLGLNFRLCAATLLAVGVASSPVSEVRADSILSGDAAAYTLLFDGNNSNTLQITSVTVSGNVGVGGGQVVDSGPSTINGTISFSADNTGQFSSTNNANVFGGPVYNSASVAAAVAAVNNLNNTIGHESGTPISINGSTTINASSGRLDSSGNEVFTVTSFSLAHGQTLTINGNGHDVVLNFTSGPQLLGNTVLTGGLHADQVLWNFVGGSGPTLGPTLTINNNASGSAANVVQGVFLDPFGAITLNDARISGNVIGGAVSGGGLTGLGGGSQSTETFSQSSLIATTPEPSSIILFVLGATGLLGFGIVRRSRCATLAG